MTDKKKVISIELQASCSRNYGAETVTYGASLVVEIAGADDVTRGYNKLMTMLYQQHIEHTKEFLPIVADPSRSGAPPWNDGEWHPAESIVVEIKEGKRYYAVKGGKYSAHGVRVWDEVLKAAGYLPELEDTYKLDLTNTEMLVVQGDKGVKVAKFRKVESA